MPLQAVVHVNFDAPERQSAGLRNVKNMLDAADNAEIHIVCHGPGISLLVENETPHAAAVAELRAKGVRFFACQNTLDSKQLTKEQLVDGTETVPSGAVDVVRKQQTGFGYFRP